MLQMNCPQCNGIIRSPLLAEISTVECGQCKENVAVQDVFVSTNGFVMHRDDLLKRIFRYQTLLREVEQELLLMENNESVSEATRKSIRQFHTTIQELLVGSRKNFRLEIPFDLPVEFDFSNQKIKGRLKNLSSEGASIELEMRGKPPQMRSPVRFELPLPGIPEPLALRAKVVWVRVLKNDESPQTAFIGLNFTHLNEKVHDCIWDFIVKTLPKPTP